MMASSEPQKWKDRIGVQPISHADCPFTLCYNSPSAHVTPGQTAGLGEPAAYGIWGALVDGKTHNRKLGATINTSRGKESRPDFFPFRTLKKILGDKRTACTDVCGVRPGGLVS